MAIVTMLFGLGPIGLPEILFLLLICLLIFGAKKLPEIGSGLGKGIRGFKDSIKGEDESKKELKDNGNSRANENKPVD